MGDAVGADLQSKPDMHCGTDIQMHSVKGAISVRIDELAVDRLAFADIQS